MVGVERFELPTLWSQTRCATRLRYTPNKLVQTKGLEPLWESRMRRLGRLPYHCLQNLVDRRGIEPRPQACKAHVLPLSLSAHKTWCPRRDSNSQNLASKTNTYTYSVTGANWLHRQGSNLRPID